MKINSRIDRLEKRAEGLRDKMVDVTLVWVSAPPMPESIEEWENFAQWQLGNTDGSALRPEYRQTCTEYFERVKAGLIRTIM